MHDHSAAISSADGGAHGAGHGSRRRPRHPLLELQRHAGNQAVVRLIDTAATSRPLPGARAGEPTSGATGPGTPARHPESVQRVGAGLVAATGGFLSWLGGALGSLGSGLLDVVRGLGFLGSAASGPAIPASADEVRAPLASATPASLAEAGRLLAPAINALQALQLSHSHATVDELAQAYADGTPGVDVQAAKAEIIASQTRALTLPTDHFHQLAQPDSGIPAASPSDEIHELIHICSAPGGLNQLKNDTNNLNEGVVQLFTHAACAVLGIQVQAAYMDAMMYPLAQRLATGGIPVAVLWKACFASDGGTAPIAQELGLRYKAARPNAKMGGREPTSDEWAAEFDKKLKAGNPSWLNLRLGELNI